MSKKILINAEDERKNPSKQKQTSKCGAAVGRSLLLPVFVVVLLGKRILIDWFDVPKSRKARKWHLLIGPMSRITVNSRTGTSLLRHIHDPMIVSQEFTPNEHAKHVSIVSKDTRNGTRCSLLNLVPVGVLENRACIPCHAMLTYTNLEQSFVTESWVYAFTMCLDLTTMHVSCAARPLRWPRPYSS